MSGAEGNLLLAIDTATANCGIALFGGTLVAEYVWHTKQAHTTELLPAVRTLLDRQALTFGAVRALAVSVGPGSFNGLRVGISTAKGLALSLDIPCVGVGALEATAFQHAPSDRDIRPVYDAARGEVATALYRQEGEVLRAIEEPRLTTMAALAAEISRPTLICGELQAAWIGLLQDRPGKDVVSFPAIAGQVRRPGYLAELAWRRWKAGERDDLATLQPIYLRRPAITPARGREPVDT